MRWACVCVEWEEGMSVRGLARALLAHTPGVEPCEARPGRAWLDPSGFDVEGDYGPWARGVLEALEARGWGARLGLGSTRAGAAVLAAGAPRGSYRLARGPAQEREAIAAAPPRALCDDEETLEALAELGMGRIGDLEGLDGADVRERLGAHAEALARAGALSRREAPLRPHRERERTRGGRVFEWASWRVEPVVRAVEDALPGMLEALAGRHEVAARVVVGLWDAGGEEIASYALVPARGPLGPRAYLELLGLRLEREPPGRAVQEVRVEAFGRPAEADAGALVGGRGRDVEAGARAVARAQAAWGEEAVGSLEVVRAHLPAQRARLARARSFRRARPAAELGGVIVRTRRDEPVRSERPPVGRIVARGVRVSTGWWEAPDERVYAVFERGGKARWAHYDVVLGVWVCEGEC